MDTDVEYMSSECEVSQIEILLLKGRVQQIRPYILIKMSTNVHILVMFVHD